MHPYTKQINIGRIATSKKEIIDILKAWIAVSVAFGIVLGGSLSNFHSNFIIAALTVGVGFLLHELGHKFAAQRYGCFAEFRSFDSMLILAVAMSFFGFVFAAPGAVMISGRINQKKNGIISVAGPLVNIALALAFLALALADPPKIFKLVSSYGFIINSWLALFNMMPFWLFDGSKIWKWNKFAYLVIAGTAFALVFGSNLVR